MRFIRQASCRIRDICGKQPAGGTVGALRRRGMQAFTGAGGDVHERACRCDGHKVHVLELRSGDVL